MAAEGHAAPETHADALVAPGRLGVVSGEVARVLTAAVGLRNLLAYEYLDVDHGRLHDELGWIEDAVALAAQVESWLQQRA